MQQFQQGSLFPCGLDMRSAQEVKLRIMNAKFARNTLKTYRSSWKSFERWCREAGRIAMPASPEDCIDHAAWCFAAGLRWQTAYLRLKAINHYHKKQALALPCNSEVREFMRNAKRELCERDQGKAALTPMQLRKLSKVLQRRTTAVNIRNRALILLCFACGWRRSEIISLDLRDVRWVGDGIELWLGKSKTDQEGRGRLVRVQYGRRKITCPLTALKQWLELRGAFEGPLFTCLTPGQKVTGRRLSGETVCRAVKRGIELIGQDAKTFGAHSLRSGMITASLESGATETSVMQRTGHRCRQTLQRYVRPATVFRANPLRRVL